MRFRQIFVTINMLMDHTTSSPLIPQLDMSASANPSKIASQVASGSNGVVYPATTQQYNQKLEEAAQVKAMAEKTYGPPSYPIHRDRKMQELQYVNGPPGSVPSTPEQMTQISNAAPTDSKSHGFDNLKVVVPLCIVGFLVAILGPVYMWHVLDCFEDKESATEKAYETPS
ncbi:uncharacterized protein MELLADRAFT_90164 [Melampsora larici-populina 98AG31]|uniref:Uncharacterized protein n=1 Tax=Melampsora larici-populina (strain 98AG31 / pathotype 3-4-7) TaxID=747676 RepID=F4RVX3_MELLP|nr:uncharacterized protein MELLADRAFT_90164 [Melampsora larici-populina 98AG31]EGG03509.1 hypothetical protein MELLADRAFT_90164 [Melampsora larici-populina 98AG31]